MTPNLMRKCETHEKESNAFYWAKEIVGQISTHKQFVISYSKSETMLHLTNKLHIQFNYYYPLLFVKEEQVRRRLFILVEPERFRIRGLSMSCNSSPVSGFHM